MQHLMKSAHVFIHTGQIEPVGFGYAASKIHFPGKSQNERYLLGVKDDFVDNGVIRQVTNLPIDRHIAVQGNALQQFPFFIGTRLPAGRCKDPDSLLPCLMDRFQGARGNEARLRAGKRIVHITKYCFDHCLSLIVLSCFRYVIISKHDLDKKRIWRMMKDAN